jgi:hypothetical protein
MPCHDYGYAEWAKENSDKAMESHNEFLKKSLDKNDKLTRLLCYVCKHFESGEHMTCDDPLLNELWAWWQEHKELDKQREDNNAAE